MTTMVALVIVIGGGDDKVPVVNDVNVNAGDEWWCHFVDIKLMEMMASISTFLIVAFYRSSLQQKLVQLDVT